MTTALATIHERPTPRCVPAAHVRVGVRRAEPSPNYALRRGVVGVLLAATVVVLGQLGSTLASFGGDPAAAAETRPAGAPAAVHVASAGDTMWSIAHHHRGDVAHERFLDALVRLNGGSEIQVGQAVLLP